MMTILLMVISIVAAFNAVMIAIALAIQERFGSAPLRLTLAGYLSSIGVLLGLFVVLDVGLIDYNQRLGVLMDAGAILVGALFFNYVCLVCGKGSALWSYAAAPVYLLSVGLTGGRYFAPDDIGPIVIAQIGFSLASFGVYLRQRLRLPPPISKRSENRHLPALFGGVALLHGSQLLRLSFPRNNLFFDLVPLIGACGILLISFYGIFGSQTLKYMSRSSALRNGSLDHKIQTGIVDANAYLDPDLSLQKAAALIGVTPRELSQFINTQRGRTFREFLNDLRIEEARRLLADPREQKTSIEAIALLSGFKSRSSFYEAFSARSSDSPAAFRQSALA
ncbi:MAG: AraC family transcriptional regulator, partial [Hyphococcus sp.]